jgi:hypothetical protein
VVIIKRPTLFQSISFLGLLLVLTVTMVQLVNPITAIANTPTMETLQNQGYSPEMIDMTNVAQGRAEGRGIAPPKRTPMQQLLQNIWTNNVTDGMDPFGYTLIRRH